MSDDTNIQLLAQRLQSQEDLNARQSGELRELRSVIDQMKGEASQREKGSGWAQKLLPTGIGLAAALFSTIIWAGQQTNGANISEVREKLAGVDPILADLLEHADEEGHPAKMITRLAVLEENVNALKGKKNASHADFHAHRELGIHPKAAVQMENVHTRLKVIEDNLEGNADRFASLTADVVGLQSDTKTLAAGIIEHEEEIDSLEDKVAKNISNISSVKASTGAAFVEVETQIRGTTDVNNLMFSQLRQTDAIIYRKAFGEDLPENDFFPENIPAKATTTVGKINGG